MKKRERSHRMAYLLLRGWRLGVFTLPSNAADLDLSDDEKSNARGDSSDDDAENKTNQIYNDEEKLDPYRLENFILDDSDDELTEHQTGTNGALAQLINVKQWARNYVWMAKEEAYLSEWLWCAALLGIALSEPLDCEAILITLLPMLRSIRSLETSIYGAVKTTQQREEAVQH